MLQQGVGRSTASLHSGYTTALTKVCTLTTIFRHALCYLDLQNCFPVRIVIANVYSIRYSFYLSDYCVDWSLYAVDESTTYTSTSTPEKNPKQVPRISTDIAKLEYSRIEPVGGIVSNINETCMTEFELTMLRDSKISSEGSAHKSDASSSKTLKELDCLDLQQIKKLGLFLDGCRIYICGFFGTRLDKLQRIINFGGGTR